MPVVDLDELPRFGEAKPYNPSWAEQLKAYLQDRLEGMGAKRGLAQDWSGTAANMAGFAPGVGNLLSGNEAYRQFSSGHPIRGALATLGAVPLPGAAIEGALGKAASLRGLPVAQAIEAARAEPHLIPAGNRSAGYYIGGPQDIQSPADLAARRSEFDAYVAQDPRGADWYDRYRAGLNRATGGDPDMNRWMSTMQGSWSQGVNPESEAGFAIKEANAALAGQPARAGMESQHQGLMDAIAANDPTQMQLGRKTGQYAGLVNPVQAAPPGGVGVNDFRYANQWGYRPEDVDMRGSDVSLTAPQHNFLDYETALAAGRANQAGLGGRTDWTGEQIQAAPWVRQKALALEAKGPLAVRGDYDAAFAEANKTAPDFFPKHAASATWEAQPGIGIPGHMPLAAGATPEQRAAYMAAPGSWASAPSVGLQPGELPRDAIYGGLRLGDTGVGMYTLPSRPMTGVYQNSAGGLETNPGAVARPLVAFSTAGPSKTVAPADQALLNAGELTRSYFGAQEAGAWHKTWPNPRLKDANSVVVPLDRPATPQEITALQDAGAPHGFPHATSSAGGVTLTNFDKPPPTLTPKTRDALLTSLEDAKPDDAGKLQLASLSSGFQPLVEQFKQGQGSGAATQHLLDTLNQTPELRQAFNQNPFIPPVAAAQAQRDIDWTGQYGAPRPDIQNARILAGQGPGWVDRLQTALKVGVPAGAGLAPTAGLPATPSQPDQDQDWATNWMRQKQDQYAQAMGFGSDQGSW
jgi:hypothetical protein